jgi:hypothetical protein
MCTVNVALLRVMQVTALPINQIIRSDPSYSAQ